MSNNVQFIVDTKQAEEVFNSLNIKKQSNILRVAIRNVLTPVLKEAQSNIIGDFQRDSGDAYKSLGISLYRKNIGGAVGARINGANNGFYAKFLDMGTAPRIRKKGGETGKLNPSLFFSAPAQEREGSAGVDLANGVIFALNKAINKAM